MSKKPSINLSSLGQTKDLVKDIKKRVKVSFTIYVIIILLSFILAFLAQFSKIDFFIAKPWDYFKTALGLLGSSAVVASMIMLYANSFWKNSALSVIKQLYQRKQHSFITSIFTIYLATVPAALCFYGLGWYPFAMFGVYTNLMTLVYLGYLLLMIGNIIFTGKRFIDDLTFYISQNDATGLLELIDSALANNEKQKLNRIYSDIAENNKHILFGAIIDNILNNDYETNREDLLRAHYKELISIDNIPLERLVYYTYSGFLRFQAPSENIAISKLIDIYFDVLSKVNKDAFLRVFWLLATLSLLQNATFKSTTIFDNLGERVRSDNNYAPENDNENLIALREFLSLGEVNLRGLLRCVHENYFVQNNNSGKMDTKLKEWVAEAKAKTDDDTERNILENIAKSDLIFLIEGTE